MFFIKDAAKVRQKAEIQIQKREFSSFRLEERQKLRYFAGNLIINPKATG